MYLNVVMVIDKYINISYLMHYDKHHSFDFYCDVDLTRRRYTYKRNIEEARFRELP